MKSAWAILALLTLTTSGLAAMALPPAAVDAHSGFQEVPANDRARGRVFDGLSPGKAGTLCQGLLEIAAAGCTHGPDAAPAEANVAAAVAPATAAAIAAATPIRCPPGEDGSSGMRVQAIYAYEQGKPNRYATYATSFPVYAGNVEATYALSAAQTGGTRHVRWVTDSQCHLLVQVAALPPGSLASISTMRSALQALGYNSAARKYLVWADATVYCGIGYFYNDDSPQGDGTVNANDGKSAMYARIDSGCWGLQNSVEAHELMHNLGGVQASAPRATNGAHCVDDADRMCYNDGKLKAGQTMLTRCASTQERFLDCNHDDYYHTSPPAGSYLATHWNAASSRFLFQDPGFAATFQPRAVGNDWWIEAAVTATKPVAKVEARVADGAWTTLPATSWGTWAKSLHAPNGAPVAFRAYDATGANVTGPTIVWT
ncbi:MAG: hypothetical protein QOD77_1333 [Thermoplasmata archaeon]|jgi:hypothetical protein|nr:hypothetical protein [Thermoplasmata archaeon]